jgi:hypothetical protein
VEGVILRTRFLDLLSAVDLLLFLSHDPYWTKAPAQDFFAENLNKWVSHFNYWVDASNIRLNNNRRAYSRYTAGQLSVMMRSELDDHFNSFGRLLAELRNKRQGRTTRHLKMMQDAWTDVAVLSRIVCSYMEYLRAAASSVDPVVVVR